MTEPEIPLPGGDVTQGVVRVGATVRRPVGAHSPLVHRVLRHLDAVGFDGAPRLLGRDERGREILTFVDGEVAGRPWAAWVGDADRAVSVARLLRRLDDAMLSFGVADQPQPAAPEAAERPWAVPQFVGHRDITPENTVFRDGRAHALIDFDLAGATSRVLEFSNLVLWWGGWMPPADRDPVFGGVDVAERGRLLADAYGLTASERRLVVPASIDAAGRSWERMRQRAERDGGGWARMWADGVGDRIRRREAWLASQDALREAMR